MSSPMPVAAETGFSNATREEIQRDLDELNRMTDRTEQIFTLMKRIQEEYVINYQQFSQITGDLSNLLNSNLPAEKREELKRKMALRQKLETSSSQLYRFRLDLTKKHTRTLSQLELIQRKVVIDARKIFQRKQQLAGNGAPFGPESTDELQEWCEGLSDVILRNRAQIINESELRQLLPIDSPPGTTDEFPNLIDKVNDLLALLIKSTFVIEQQPHQVLKKDCKFSSTVRLLVGGRLNLQFDPPRVKATLISEKQACDVANDKEIQTECGDILNGEGPMEYHAGRLSINFRSMSLRGFQRPTVNRRVAEPVTEEKFCIRFTSVISLSGQAQRFEVWTISLPIIVTVHGNQECNAAATALWDNQFAQPGRTPFIVPDIVPWVDVASMLSMRFYGWTGQGLNDRSLAYLANKLFGNDLNRSEVSWTKFNKDPISGSSFTFWEWFWSVGKLVKESLKDIWQRGLIMGFIDKNECSSQLMAMPTGTFLLRFSDRLLGGVTIALVKENPDAPGGREVEHLRPFTNKDFVIRKLADRIHDLGNLRSLYPDRCKDEVFGEFYTCVEDGPLEGYTAVTLINVIAGEPSGSAMDLGNAGSPFGSSNSPSPAASYTSSQSSPLAQEYAQMLSQQGSYQPEFAQAFYCPPTPQGFSQAFAQNFIASQQQQQGGSTTTYDRQQNGNLNGLGAGDWASIMDLDEIDIDADAVLNLLSGGDT